MRPLPNARLKNSCRFCFRGWKRHRRPAEARSSLRFGAVFARCTARVRRTLPEAYRVRESREPEADASSWVDPCSLDARGALGFGLGFGEELDQVLLPDGGGGVGSVAAGLVGDGDEDELCVRHALCELLGDA